MAFVDTAIQFLKISDVTTISVSVEKLNPLLARTNFNMVSRSENPINYEKNTWRPGEKGIQNIEMREREWWDQVQMSSFLKNHVRKYFPYKLPLRKETLLKRIDEDKLFGYVQCDLEVSEEIYERFANFPPVFENTNVGREDIGDFMREYAEKNDLLMKPQRMLIWSYKLNNGIVITPLLKFYLKLGLRCTKIYRFVKYTPQKCFNDFLCHLLLMRDEREIKISTRLLLLIL